MNHICILIWIIFLIGAFAGLTNFLFYYYKGHIKNKYEMIKYVLSGIGASILVPLFLNMLSSSLIEFSDDYNKINYFVFAGFCFVAGYFSDRFINSVGERVLKDLEKTNIKIEEAMSNTKQNEEKLDILVSSESDIDEEEVSVNIDLSKFKEHKKFADDDIKTQIDKVIKSFLGKYRFRTAKGISKELDYNVIIVESILNELQEQGMLKMLTDKDGKTLWAVTHLGKMFGKELKDKV